jgi:hypothetical protein
MKQLLSIISSGLHPDRDKLKTMENYLNVLHYCFYKAHYKFHLLANKVNPFRLLTKIPFVKKRLEKKGIMDIEKEIDNVFQDKNFGLSMTIAGGVLWGEISVLFFSILIIFNVPISTPYIIIACSVLSSVISYFFVFRNNKYIEYFDRYKNWSKAEKQKYSWFTLASIIVVFLLFYLGLKP